MSECDGGCDYGWVSVKEPYARGIALETVAETDARFPTLMAALLNSVYPCRVCQPAQFHRWREGHLARDHDRGLCGACLALGSGRGSSRRAKAAVHATAAAARSVQGLEPPPPGDDDAPPPDHPRLPELRERADLS